MDPGFWALDDDVPVPSLVAAIGFVGQSSSNSWLILCINLWSCKRLLIAHGLIDLWSEGNFVDDSFVQYHSLGLLSQKHQINFSGFDGAATASGAITHFWSGSMTMIGTNSQLFHSFIKINFTKLGGFDLILRAGWFDVMKNG